MATMHAEAGRVPGDRGLLDLVVELCTGNPRFRGLWETQDVMEQRAGVLRLHHPDVGDRWAVNIGSRGRPSGRQRPHERPGRARAGRRCSLGESWRISPPPRGRAGDGAGDLYYTLSVTPHRGRAGDGMPGRPAPCLRCRGRT